MEMNSLPKSYSELISASNNVLTGSASCGSSLPLPIVKAGSGDVHDGGMAAAASKEEEQCKEVEIMPAAPDPDQLRQQEEERDVMAHPDFAKQHSVSEEVEAKIKEVLRVAQALRARISQLLGPAGPHRVVTTGDAGRRCLALVDTEISFVAASLTTLNSNLNGDGVKRRHLQHFSGECSTGLLARLSVFLEVANHVFREITVCKFSRRAAQCFRRVNSVEHLYSHILDLYVLTEASYRYLHDHPTRYYLGLTPQLAKAEAGALPLVGIDRPAKKILRWLSQPQQGTMDRSQLRVVSIVGPMGIGKTTLAVELRNRIRQHVTSGGHYYFQCNVMAQASRGADRNILLLQDILSQVSEPAAATALSSDPSSEDKTMEVLVRLVSECLRDKRYFVIIDDLWEASDWWKIEPAFPRNNLDSRILVTTRSTITAWLVCCSHSYDGLVHEMKPLSEVDSESLLQAKAVGSMDGCLPNNMKLHCDEILRRCDDVPLFIIGMADWLKGQRLQKQHPREGEDEEQQRLAMQYEEQVPRLPERLEQALSSAFYDFPHVYSRLLLLYMSMFPYGYKFEKDRLILKWLHEGLTHHNPFYNSQSSAAMSEAETFFSQLVDRNVISCVASNCKHKQDEPEACQWQVNHFMQQLFASKSAEIGFIFTPTTLNLLAASAATTTECDKQTSSRMPRRLALHHPDPLLPSLLETMDLSQTRSLAVSGAINSGIIPLHRFVNLVVLDLEGWENLKDEDLLQVCRSKMIFLSYLSVRNTRVSKLPVELFELKRLSYMDLRSTQIRQLPKQIVGLRDSLSRLLVGGEGTINSVETAMPHDVRRLSRLYTLATVDLTQHTASFVRALGDLYRLKVLAVTWSFDLSTDRDYCEALLSSIGNWRGLESLTIHCGLGCSMEFLGSLEMSRAPWWLEKFKVIAGRFASVPPWIHGLGRLAFVQITVCNKQTTTHDLKILGDLPKLQCLILGLDFIPGQPIVIGNEGFHELQRFSVDCPMPWLTFNTGAMWKLTYLQLKFCSTPASQLCVPSGISNLHRLTEVALFYNVHYINSPSVKMTVEAVTQQVAEHHNPIDLFINGFELYDVQEADDEVTEITIGTSSRSNAGAEDDAQAVGEEATAEIQCEITEAES